MSLVREFQEALAAEIEEQKKKGTARWDVRAGRLVEVRGPLFVYCFILDDPTLAGAFDDTPVLVRAADRDASGHVVGISGSQIFVAVESNLGDYVPSARILAQPYRLLEQLSERLGTLQETSCIIANRCMGLQTIQHKRDLAFVPEQELVAEWDELNEDQEIAIRQALGSEVCYVWGPPGTGKTRTVGITVASMIQRGQTILVTANTNVAVDQALTACLKPLKQTKHYADGRILRLGTPQTSEIAEDDKLNLDKITELKSQPLREQVLNLREQLVSTERRFAELEAVKTDFGEWQETQRKITGEVSTLTRTEESLRTLTQRKAVVEKALQCEEERRHRAKSMSAMMRFIRGMTLSKIEDSISSLQTQHDAMVDQEAKLEARVTAVIGTLGSLREKAKRVEKTLQQQSVSPKTLGNEIASAKAKIDDLHTQITDLERQIEAVRQQVISEAVLIATTLARTYTMSEVYGRRFDTVVCDEASMAPIPAVYWAGSLATKSITVAGDFRQLSPIALSNAPGVKEWLRRDIYAASGVDKGWQLGQTQNSPMVMLRTQYRMQPSIRTVISRVFYFNLLLDARPEEPALRAFQPCPGVYAGVYDTSTIDPWCSWTSSYSRFNLYHAVLAVRLCQMAAKDFENIGVITPYKAQTRLIKILVDMDPTLRGKVTVSNVHRFQGREGDLIIFDLVDSTGLRIGKLLKGRIDSDDIDDTEGARLINVACSRAKRKLAIIANLAFLKSRLNDTWSLHDVLFNERDALPTFAADQLLPGYSDHAVRRAREILWPAEAMTAASFYTESEFHSALRTDIESAKQYVIVMSPFITQERAQTYVELLRQKAEQGIDVEVVTRPPNQQGTLDRNNIGEILSYLAKSSIKVAERRLMHQKVIVIDGQIVWFGSLNPLSHRNTQELMFRFDNQEFTKQVMEECGLQAPGEKGEALPPAIDVTKIPPRLCIRCGQNMKVIPRGRFGPFYKCEPCSLTANVKRDDLRHALLPEAKTCPKCGRELELRWSTRGMFLGCSGYKDKENQCKYTRSL